jgi:succinyl-CoA synthetase beta subunit/citryl-CoA synthetase large subunit
MTPLLEADAKRILAAAGIAVPQGRVARSAEDAAGIAREIGGPVVVKAHVPAGRKGKAGAVQFASGVEEAAARATALLGREVAGFTVAEVYVEARRAVERELFIAFGLDADGPYALVSGSGGVDIEHAHAAAGDVVLRERIDPLRGLPAWTAIELWRRAGVRGAALRDLGAVAARLYECFVANDAVSLEVNPLALCADGSIECLGAMIALDEHAAFRHPGSSATVQPATRSANPREERVRRANLEYEGGEAEYQELDGNIGLLVGGGGAGLYLHDTILDLGGRPANHSVTPPNSATTDKLRTVIEAILDNPRVEGLLVGFNYAQMARNDVRMEVLADVLRARAVDTARFPVVVRLFGGGETKARAIAGDIAGLDYMPPGTTLYDAAQRIVERVAARAETAKS